MKLEISYIYILILKVNFRILFVRQLHCPKKVCCITAVDLVSHTLLLSPSRIILGVISSVLQSGFQTSHTHTLIGKQGATVEGGCRLPGFKQLVLYSRLLLHSRFSRISNNLPLLQHLLLYDCYYYSRGERLQIKRKQKTQQNTPYLSNPMLLSFFIVSASIASKSYIYSYFVLYFFVWSMFLLLLFKSRRLFLF